MPTTTLGRLISVPLREVWAHEARDFTPWLATADNLTLLAETLGLGELEIQGTEVAVGNFSIDILARDIEGSIVVIENQFGATDHTHLGQIMTYVAGQEGDLTVVWIAEAFREEHRAAIDWLNSSTNEGFAFFAVEVEALRIGDSVPAPRFNVVGKPNEWSRGVTRTTRQAGGGAANERQAFYTRYWSEFGAFLAERQSAFRVRGVTNRFYSVFPIGRGGVQLVANAGQRDGRIAVELYISRDDDKATFRALEEDKSNIERIVGEPLDWQELPEKIASRIAIFKTADPNDEDDRANQFAWLVDWLERFRTVFKDRIGVILPAVQRSAQIP